MQVSFSQWFQELFSSFQGFFDVFWSVITFCGEEIFFILVCAFVYWILDKHLAKIMATATLTSLVLNGVLKEICKIERPIADENVRFVEVDNIFVSTTKLIGTYSFPSGHAMISSSIFFSIASFYKNKKIWIEAIILSLLVCLSRIYLGVHWLFDVTVGASLGFIIVYGVLKLYERLKNKEIFIYIGLIVGALILVFLAKSSDDYKGIGAIIGLASGLIFEEKLVGFDPKEGKVWKKVLRYIIGVALIFALKEGLKFVFNLIGDYEVRNVIRYFIIVFFGVGIYPLIFKKIKL